jgi:hypothetical protein
MSGRFRYLSLYRVPVSSGISSNYPRDIEPLMLALARESKANAARMGGDFDPGRQMDCTKPSPS